MEGVQYGQYTVPSTDELVNFGVGQPSSKFLPLKMIQEESMKDHLFYENPDLLQYGDIKGYKQFRQALLDFMSSENPSFSKGIDTENIMVTNGNTGAVSLLFSFFNSDMHVFVEDPTYFLMVNIIKNDYGFKNVHTVPMTKDGLNLSNLQKQLEEHKESINKVGAVLYTIPTYHNPTGYTLTHEKRIELAKLAEVYNMKIIADEVYQFLYFDEKPPAPMYTYSKNAYSLFSFSKILAPSLRLGWICVQDPKLLELIVSSGQLDSSGGINPFVSSIVHPLITKGHLVKNIERLRKELSERSNHLSDQLNTTLFEFERPKGGYFLWLRVRKQASAEKMAEYKVKYHNGAKFYYDNHPDGNQFIRLSFSYYDYVGMEVGAKRLNELYSVKHNLKILGATGKLGSRIVELGKENGLDFKSVDRDITNVNDGDIVIDVSSPSGTENLLRKLIADSIVTTVIIGTTNIEHLRPYINLYDKIGTVKVYPNFSIGIRTVQELINVVNKPESKKLWNMSMKEIHHVHKKDAPSGTAKLLGTLAGICFDEIESVREGEVVGTHILTLKRKDEVIEIKHQALNRDIFAQGALEVVKSYI